jgi:HK97 family phage portal protein
MIEQIARIYSIPPTFLQDLTHGTFSNTEQQDLHFTKHTIKRWIEQFEQEMNLKLFGRNSNSQFVEMNVDGLLRGDFKTRMDGYAQGIQNAILTPNEARRRENLPDDAGGDGLLVQGATVPLGQQPTGSGDDNDGA